MRLEDWEQCGLRPSTVRKICDGFGQINECQNMKERMKLGSDAFIENCARINGAKSNTDINGIYIQCF